MGGEAVLAALVEVEQGKAGEIMLHHMRHRVRFIGTILLLLIVQNACGTAVSGQISDTGENGAFRDIRLGGYVDLELFASSQRFDFKNHRLVPMIDATVSRAVHFSCEIEFEYGGPQSAAGDGEVKVEFAHLDIDMGGWQLRSGAILVPLGSTNLHHDSPLRELTQRPLVARSVIPSTLTSAGVGSLWQSSDGDHSIEAYLLNGFNGGDAINGYNIDSSKGLRSARPSLKVNGDRSASFCGRWGWTPSLGTELGFSTWVGSWDEEGELDLGISVIDLTSDLASLSESLANIELEVEVAQATIDVDAAALAAAVPEQLSASSFQLTRRFFPTSLEDRFGPEASCGCTIRWELQDLGAGEKTRTTIGFHLRPSDETILKFDYEQEQLEGQPDPDGTLILSAATYF